MLQCSRCKQMKSRDQFSRPKPGAYCRPCAAEWQREYRLKYPTRVKENYKRSYALRRDRVLARLRKIYPQRLDAYKDYKLRAAYGITLAEQRHMLLTQNGVCAICRDALTRPYVDHDHVTGVLRGLLCVSCNSALGLAKDDPAILRTMADYIEKARPVSQPLKLVTATPS